MAEEFDFVKNTPKEFVGGSELFANLEPSGPVQTQTEAPPQETSPVSMISTDEGINQVRKDEEKLTEFETVTAPLLEKIAPDAVKTAAEKTTAAASAVPEPIAPAPVEPTAPAGEGFSLEEAVELFGSDFTGLTRVGDKFVADASALERLGVTGVAEPTEEEKEIEEATEDVKDLDNQIEGLVNEFTTFNIDEDPEFASQAQVIRQQFKEIRQKSEKINESRQRAIRSRGIRRGTVKFAGDIQSTIESEELTQAGARIAKINSEEAAAISNARRLFKQDKFSELNTQINAIQLLRNNKAQEIENYNQALLAVNEKLQEKQDVAQAQLERSTRDTAISGLFESGITDPNLMLNFLNFDDAGNRIGDFTAEEVSETLGFIKREDPEVKDTLSGLSSDFKTYEFLRDNRPQELESIGVTTYLEYVRALKGAQEGKVVGDIGASVDGGFPTAEDLDRMTIDERNFVNAVLRQLPTKLTDSEQEKEERQREALFDFRQGKGLQETIDTFRGLVFDTNVKQADRDLGNTFRSLAAGSDLELSEISAPINQGKPTKAMTVVENANLALADQDFSNLVLSQTVIKRSAEALNLLSELPSEFVGLFDFKANKWLAKTPAGAKNEDRQKMARIAAILNGINKDVRKEFLGSAITETEKVLLEDFLAEMKDQPEIINIKLDEMQNDLLARHNAARNTTNLPQVTKEQLIDNNLRLNLYRDLAGGVPAGLSGINIAQSFNTLDDLVTEHPEALSIIEQIELEDPNITDQELLDIFIGGVEAAGFRQGGGGTPIAVDVASAGRNIEPVKIGTRTVRVDNQIADKLARADKAFFEATGKHIEVNQSFRSREQQEELFRKSEAGEIGRAAPPGKSFHEKGLAVDVTNWEEAEPFLRRFGFMNELADDKGHFSIGEFTNLV